MNVWSGDRMALHRRTVLGLLGGGLVSVAGCSNPSPTATKTEVTDSPPPDMDTAIPSPTGTPTATETPTQSVEFGTPANPPEPGVRRAQDEADVHRHETVDREFLSYPELECGRTAAAAARVHVQEQENITQGLGSGFSKPTDDHEDRVAVVRHVTTYRRDGTKGAEPPIDYDRLVEVTPRIASATIEHDDIEQEDNEYDCTHPVYVERTWVQEQ